MNDGYDDNPYSAPQSWSEPPRPATEPDIILPCPACSSTGAEPAPYNWWRGRRAPKAVEHVICKHCQCEYNGETGLQYPPARSPVPLFVVAVLLFLGYLMLVCGGALVG